jgi:hypothetical protein
VRHEAYLRVVGDEATIQVLHRKTGAAGAAIQQIKARDEKSGELLWVWATEHVDVAENDVDAGVNAVLTRYRGFFTSINEYRGLDSDLYLELVTFYREGDEPAGLYLSAETIKLLGELGADFDNDAVHDIR